MEMPPSKRKALAVLKVKYQMRRSRQLQRQFLSVYGGISFAQFGQRKFVGLCAIRLYRICCYAAPQLSASLHIKPQKHALDESGAIRIPCAGRIEYDFDGRGNDFRFSLSRKYTRPFTRIRSDDRWHMLKHADLRPARFLHDEIKFIIAGKKYLCPRNRVFERFGGEYRDLLPRIIKILESATTIVGRQRHHVGLTSGAHDGERPAIGIDGSVVCMRAGTRVKSRDLIIGFIGEEKRRRGKLAFNFANRPRIDTGEEHVLAVLAKIGPYRRDNFRLLPQERERVGHIARRAAEFDGEFIDTETQINAVQLVGHEVIGEESRIIHDAVVGH